MRPYHLLLLFSIVSCNPPSKNNETLTALPFAVTGAPSAMPHFQKGLLLLHNFEYEDAAESFVEAQRADSTFVMAYWGEAMTYNHPIWAEVDVDKAREILQKLGNDEAARVDNAKTPIEKD